MSKNRIPEMCAFENFLWTHFNPAEVLEEWAGETTEAVMRLAIVAECDPSEISLPISDRVLEYVVEAHAFFRTPLEERSPNEGYRTQFFSGPELSQEELRWVARHIQANLIPDC